MDTFNPSQMPPMPSQPEKKPIGPLVAVIVILALIVVGGLYFLKTRSVQKTYTPPEISPTVVQPKTDSVTDSLKQQSSSDNLSSIESDLNATNLNNIDQGAAAVEASLQ